ncbi:unnamed protein product [Adineta ricciae]|uniref:DUF4795 domain-containing protein n=1 Tax=Adineta ricciae TaxID=249248 RepID=A0A816D7M3_ADIRI|nr:unnamed protein product [Adineta ricciae]CAF1632200.1 unnamed protein product [Adineta ricciae]
MTDRLSLEQLVHLSLGDPETGAVNFNVLKTLLLQMLRAMNLYNYKPIMSDDDQQTLEEALSTSTNQRDELSVSNNQNEMKKKLQLNKRDRSSDRLNTLEEKVFRFESQLNALDQIPSNAELIDRAKQIPKKATDESDQTTDRQGPILEVWQYTQMEKRIESAENGITRLASLLQDLLSDMNDLKESHETLHRAADELRTAIGAIDKDKHEWANKSDLANLDEKIRHLENLISSLRDRFNDLPKETNTLNGHAPLDLSKFVTWTQFDGALNDIRQSMEKLSVRDNSRSSPAHGQTIIREKEELSTDGLADVFEQLRSLNDRYEQLKELTDALEEKKLNREAFDDYKTKHNDFLDRLAALERDLDGIRTHETTNAVSAGDIKKENATVQSRADSFGDLSDFRTALQRLREDLDRLKQQIQDLIKKGNLSNDELDTLKKLVQQLDQTKADKINVNNELDKKVDKRDLDTRVLKKDFKAACNDLSQNINDCLQKFHVHDDIQKQDIQKINRDINEKSDRAELDALRDYVDKQMKKLKKLAKEQQQQTQQQHVHVMSEDEAAGLRKQLIRFHCISCDRPIDAQPHPQQPSLPVNQAMRPIQSPRPYTTYELDQIRQFQKSQQFSNDFSSGVSDVYAAMRQCGGSHTTTLPYKRQIKTQPSVPEEPLLTRNEVDIKGHDGVIYKGRITVDKLPAVDMHKKNSVVLLAPPPLLRSRSDPHHQSPQPRESPGNDQDRNSVSPTIPSLGPIIPREESFT